MEMENHDTRENQEDARVTGSLSEGKHNPGSTVLQSLIKFQKDYSQVNLIIFRSLDQRRGRALRRMYCKTQEFRYRSSNIQLWSQRYTSVVHMPHHLEKLLPPGGRFYLACRKMAFTKILNPPFQLFGEIFAILLPIRKN